MFRTFISALVLSATVAAQATIQVPADHTTIQAAITAAADGDTVLVAPGTYFEFDISFQGKDISVMSSAGADATTVDAQNLGRGFFITNASGTTPGLEGFRILNGRTPSSSSSPWGGGILVSGGDVLIRACIIESCEVRDFSTDPNFAEEGAGGGIAVRSATATIESCRFFGNRAAQGDDGDPGGNGGGLAVLSGGTAFVLSCIFDDNRAGNGGDGIFSGPFDGGDGGDGGAIALLTGAAHIVNCSIWNNRAGLGGEGNTFPSGSDGNDGNGGGIWRNNGILTVRNSIVRNCVQNGGPIVAAFGDVTYSNVEGSVSGGTGNINLDPIFEDAFGADFRLQAGSPCIDTGDPSPAGLSLFDVDLMPRIAGNRVDMGAHESMATYAGSAEDFQMDVRLGGTLVVDAAIDVTVGDQLDFDLSSPGGAFVGDIPLLVAQFFTTNFHPGSPTGFPEIHVAPTATPPVLVVYDGSISPIGPLGLSSSGLGFHWAIPVDAPGSGQSLIIQALVLGSSATNGIFASSDACELRFQ